MGDFLPVDRVGGDVVVRRARGHNGRDVGMWAEGIWCPTTMGQDVMVLVGYDGMIRAAMDYNDESPAGYWRARA
jgi:hypothetical protein